MTLERGYLLNKRYRILEILGQGGMGSIYRAVDENLGVDVAVKENLFTTEEYARQFRREAVILAKLRHPNLPRVTDHFVIEGQGQYLIMDFIEGEDLRERMDREGVLGDAVVITLGAAICDALSYLHACIPQIIHRDIKPGNVKITPDGQVVLVDFGLAKVVRGSQTTTTGARAMTPGYSPPEQYGTARTDHRTDIYSLGATLYVALTAALPEDALARAMEQTQLTPIRKHNPKVSRRLASVIEKSLELRPDDRYQSADEFKRALLNCRGITGRRQTGEHLISTSSDVNAVEEDGLSQGSIDVALVEQVDQPKPLTVSYTHPLLPASTPIVDDYRPTLPPAMKKKRKFAWWPFITIIMILGLGAIYSRPDGFTQLLASMSSRVIRKNTPMNNPLPTPSKSVPVIFSATTPAPTSTDVILPTQTPTPQLPTATITPQPSLTPLPTYTPTMTATPVGGGQGQIAFASNRSGLPQIWLMNSDGSNQQQITKLPDGACQPSWSPDGLRLVFISPCNFPQETYPGASLLIVNADGTNLITLPTLPGGDYDPAWSPDGYEIAFTSLRDYNRPQIYIINLQDYSTQSLSNNIWRDFQPSWSPDGSRIVFVTTRRGPYQLWTMSSNGSDQARFSSSGSLRDTHPAWSNDAQVIVYTQYDELGGFPRLMVARFEHQGMDFRETRVTPDLFPMREAVYSPDGIWLAFEAWPQGSNHDIFIMTPNGLGRQQLTSDPGLDFDPTWRPAFGVP